MPSKRKSPRTRAKDVAPPHKKQKSRSEQSQVTVATVTIGVVPPIAKLLVTEIGKMSLREALEDLRGASDLPTSYAALKHVTECLSEDVCLTEEENALIDNALLAVPYMIYKQLIELFTRPRSFRGLAFSSAKAQLLAKKMLVSLGSSCCSVTVTEDVLLQCGIDKVDAHKVLPMLKHVGVEARGTSI